jgi:hypothetical protein
VRTFLHVGCGPLRKHQTTAGFDRPEWQEVRVDVDAAMAPDIVAGMTDMSPVPDNFAEALYSSHNIEHVHLFEVPAALAEFHRVLTDDGFAVVTCPDLQSVAALVAEGHLDQPLYITDDGPISPHDILYGHGESLRGGRSYMAHKCGFTKQSLLRALEAAGFASVGVIRRPASLDLWAIASKAERSREAMLALGREHFPLAA